MTTEHNILLKYIIKYVLDNCPNEMEFFDKFVEKGLIDKLTKLVNSKFTRIKHEDVITILKEAKVDWEFQPEYGEDIAREHEKYITEYFNIKYTQHIILSAYLQGIFNSWNN